MSGFSFKSLFTKSSEKTETIEKVEEVTTKENTSNEKSVNQATHPVITPIGGITQQSGPGVVDPKYIEILGSKLDSLNLDGEDYLELKESVENLLKIAGMNEQTAFLSAFGTLEPRGLTKESCITSIKYYTEELSKEKELFRQAQSLKYDETVSSIDDEILTLNKANENSQIEIERLTKQIEENNSIIFEKTEIMTNNKVGLENEQANFNATLSHFITVLETDNDKINKYLITPEKA